MKVEITEWSGRRWAAACLAAVVLAPWAVRAADDDDTLPLALDGYCAVRIVDEKEWELGRRDLTVVYDGRRYRFADEHAARAFREHPELYVPALGGDCVVTFAETGERTPGSIEHGLYFEGRLYLFAGDRQREAFKTSSRFENADLAFDGHSAVRLVDDGESVLGENEYTAHHDGLRYRFASAMGRASFLADPDRYQAGNAAAEAALENLLVTVEGTSACAVCDYGVRPIRNKNTLGMVVRAEDGTIYVIEDADTRYPRLFDDRFDHVEVVVRGRELKRRGRFVWLDPVSLEPAS